MEASSQCCEARAEQIARLLAVIERDLAFIGHDHLTKADLHRELHAVTWNRRRMAAMLATIFL
ncbi:hypothetical protein E4L96_09295 [Massilia arenosa]|uniref:Uncharacterized protein n=1 Tax=Zemynaea arenosa TaxID=2561931 RepID=A0A4Y9SHH8_9BURK|nr:hypothetical protein [Massilia arenosa]TFW21143.1 hypothetical protein E4L96_09295 [Massilia arenosa]